MTPTSISPSSEPSDGSLRKAWGLPDAPDFLDGPPPRPVDIAQIRALHAGTLPADEAEEVEALTVAYREWHDADRDVIVSDIQRTGEGLTRQALFGSQPSPDATCDGPSRSNPR